MTSKISSNKGISDNIPSNNISKDLLYINIIDFLTETNLSFSKSKSRRLIEQNGISLNQEKVKFTVQLATNNDLTDNSLVLQKR